MDKLLYILVQVVFSLIFELLCPGLQTSIQQKTHEIDML